MPVLEARDGLAELGAVHCVRACEPAPTWRGTSCGEGDGTSTVDRAQRDGGVALRREVLGDAYVDAALSGSTGTDGEALQRSVSEVAWGSVWTRPGLNRRSRSLTTLGMLVALNQHRELATHVRAALGNGLSRDEIVEVVVHATAYAGVPARVAAMRVVQEELTTVLGPRDSPDGAGPLLVKRVGFVGLGGGVARARQADLAVMAGGDDAILASVRPLIEATAREVIHVGSVGAGHAAKALNNLLAAGGGFVAAAEALLVGRRFGIDPATLLAVFNAGSGRNQSTETKYEKFVLSRTFDSGFTAALMRKDIGIALDLARSEGVPTLVGDTVGALWSGAVDCLGEGADQTEVIRHLEQVSGVALAP